MISDEAHRSIGGNSRAVFEYFVGYKLGLTAMPKDYLKKIDPARVNAHGVEGGGTVVVVGSYENVRLADNPKVSIADIHALGAWREVIPEYVKDYVPLNAFM